MWWLRDCAEIIIVMAGWDGKIPVVEVVGQSAHVGSRNCLSCATPVGGG